MSESLVAIVGRPNVGKSSLFNRLVGERRAIVSDIPGTTRDRISAKVTWGDDSFVLVDTGGLELIPNSDLWEKVRGQVEIAINDADAIMFLVDGLSGITPGDIEISHMLRKISKPVFLVVNKVDNPKREQESVEFNELGLREPIYISAYHNLGIQDLMEYLLPAIESDESSTSEDILRLAIVGRTNVGKSHLINSILGDERSIVSDIPGTTRDALDIPMSFEDTPMVLIDTAGVRRRGRIDRGLEKYSVLRTVRAMERSNVCLLVIDGSEPITAQDTHVAGQILDAGKGVIIVFNKCDLIQQEAYKKELTHHAKVRLKFIPYAPVCFTSALLGEGIRTLVQKALKVYKEGAKIVSDDTLKRTLMSALAAHPPSGRKGRSLRVYGISQKEARPPTFVIPVNNPDLVHFSYERYLENRLRSTFRFEGNPLNLQFQKRGGR